MAISTYVLVGFLRRDRRSNEAALSIFCWELFLGHLRIWAVAPLWLTGTTNLILIQRGVSRMDPHNPVLVIALHPDPIDGRGWPQSE